MSIINLKPIKNEEDYKEALLNLEKVFDSKIGTEEGDLAEILTILIQDYEDRNYPIEQRNDNFSFDYLKDLVDNACKLEKNVTLTDKGLKLSEEVGELAAEILKSTGIKHSNLSDIEQRSQILLESCDVLIMTLSIMNQMNFTKQEIVEMTISQIEKWTKLPK